MAPGSSDRKRKLPTKASEESDDEIIDGLLDGALSQSDDDEDFAATSEEDLGSSDEEDDGDSNEDDDDFEDGEDDLHSTDVGSDADEEDLLKRVMEAEQAGKATDGDPKDDLEANGENEDEDEDEDRANYRVVEDANGGIRYEYDEVEPVYDSDDSDAQGGENTIGDIPLSFYDSYPHIGYTIDGKKIMRPAERKDALDALLDSIEIPKGWTGLTDPNTGKPLELSQDELELLKRVQWNEIPEDGYDPYPDMVEYFTGIEEKMPLSAAPEPKRRFVPSKHEAKRVMKMVRAIREGRLAPYKPPEEREREEAEKEETYFDIWRDEQPRAPHVMHIAMPKVAPPGYDLSYNPPPEYLPTKAEKEAWEKTDPEEREKEYLPRSYDALRKVPGYETFVKERFERCLDLYLAPRVRKNRLNIDPNSLLPKLPRPEELKPFPSVCQVIFRGHEGRLRTLSVDPSGEWLATGGDDGFVRIWEMQTGRQIWRAKLSSEDSVESVRWRPTRDAMTLAAAAGEDIFMMVPQDIDPELEQASRAILDAGFGGHAATNGAQPTTADGKPATPAGKWTRPGSKLEDEGVLLKITVRSPVKTISWHRRGDHFCTVSPSGQRSSVAVHTLSKHLTQIPFRRLSGLAQAAHFHPTRPLFFVATQRTIRVYDLQKLELAKIVQPGARWISSFDLHPGGDNLAVGSYDRRLLWHDLDLSDRPYKTMRFHPQAIRAVKFHKGGLPLFADASDDGTIQILYGKVVSDLMENPTIVPLKSLKGHRVVNALGVMDVDWHPTEPFCVSAGADGTARLWM